MPHTSHGSNGLPDRIESYFPRIVSEVFDQYFANHHAHRVPLHNEESSSTRATAQGNSNQCYIGLKEALSETAVRYETRNWFAEVIYLPYDGPKYCPRVELGILPEMFVDPRRNRVVIPFEILFRRLVKSAGSPELAQVRILSQGNSATYRTVRGSASLGSSLSPGHSNDPRSAATGTHPQIRKELLPRG